MKTTSRFALAAAAGLFVGAMAFTPAKAADLGGDCCADLEERVAELEATTVRKGNRVVSVQLYGQVNQAILVWDDGVDSDAYVVDNDLSSTRIGVRGTGALKPGWTVGYRLEWQLEGTSSSADVSQLADDPKTEGNITLRQSNVYVETEQFGRLTLGQQPTATDGIAEINLGNAMGVDLGTEFVSSFDIRTDSTLSTTQFSGLSWGQIAQDLDGGSREDVLRYDSPSLYGFILSASIGDDDYADVALRFSKQWNSIRIAAGIGYSYFDEGDEDDEETQLSGSASVQHVPSGLYATFIATSADFETDLTFSDASEDYSFDRDNVAYYGQLGLSKNYFGPGASTFFVGYGYYEDGAVGTNLGGGYLSPGSDDDDFVVGSEASKVDVGFVQEFDSAATEMYVIGQYWQADELTVYDDDANAFRDDSDELEDLFVVGAGMRVKF